MGRLSSVLITVVMTVGAVWAQTANSVSVTSYGWTVIADGEQGTLAITHENLGTVMKDVRLNLQGERGLSPLKNWSVERKDQNRLFIRTAKPITGFQVELGPSTLKLSSTIAQAALTAEAPASKDRIVARVLDPRGVPVTWDGTDENIESYGGSRTRNTSFLPRRNPDVMYFALGQVSGSTFHTLFDRKGDTVISFSDQTLMRRNSQDPDLLDLTIPVPGNTLIRLIPDYYTKTLGVPFYVPFDDSYFSKAPMVWNSWDGYYEDVREEDIVRNTDWIAAHLRPYGFEYVVLDEGYDGVKDVGAFERRDHLWIGEWDKEKFPHGPQWLANYIKSKGLRAGVWLVPNAYAGAMEQHPEWYLRDKQGNIMRDYYTPALDSTNPQVLDFLKMEFTTLDDWGFDYYKFDGEIALPKYAPAVDKSRLYDTSVDPLVAYRNRLKLIRKTIGPTRFIEGCPAGTPLDGIGYANSFFTGADLYSSWQGNYALFSSINGNGFLNHIVAYVMPGEGIELSPAMTVAEAERLRVPGLVDRVLRVKNAENPMVGFGTTMAEAHTLVSYVALTGVVYPVSSIMPELPEERIQLLKKTLPSMPILPVDLFSRGTDAKYGPFKDTRPDYYLPNYPEILDLKVNAKSGVYDVVGLTNWRSGRSTRELSFADKLGLDAASSYVVLDFWNQKLLGLFRSQMKVEIEPHDTRVFLIHPLMNRPQLIGTSRHIAGAYSILDLEWDGTRKELRGLSQTVPGENYSLFLYVPKGLIVSHVRATAKGNGEVPANHELTGNSLSISFQGQQEAVDWEVKFAANTGR